MTLTNAAVPFIGASEVDAPMWRPERQASFAGMVERLFRDFEGTHSLPEIVAVARQARHDLSDVRHGAQPELIERLARQRLSDS